MEQSKLKNIVIGVLVVLVAGLGYALYQNNRQPTYMESAMQLMTEANVAMESDNGSLVDQTDELAKAIAAEIKAAND